MLRFRPCARWVLSLLFVCVTGCASQEGTTQNSSSADEEERAVTEDVTAARDMVPGEEASAQDERSCGESCARIKKICDESGWTSISDTWVSVCTDSCETKKSVVPEVAEEQLSCVAATSDCTEAVQCVADM